MSALLPPIGLFNINVFSRGDWEGYFHVIWSSPTQPSDAHPYYRIEYHDIESGDWIWLTDAPPDQGSHGIPGAFGFDVKYATAPPGGTPRTQTVDTVRITAKDLAGIYTDSTPATIAAPSLVTSHNPVGTFNVVCYGKIGDANGKLDISWHDTSKFIRSGRLTLLKYGVTSPGIQRTIYDTVFTSAASELGPSRIIVPIKLIPPGFDLHFYRNPAIPDWVNWDVINPPTNDPDAPFWVVEGDLLTFVITTFTDDDPLPLVNEFTFEYHREASLVPLVEPLIVGIDYTTYSVDGGIPIPIAQDPSLPVPITATVNPLSDTPTGMTFDPATLLLMGTPTTARLFNFKLDTTSLGNYTTRQVIEILVIPPLDVPSGAWPVIVAPVGVTLVRGEEYPPEYNLYGPGGGYVHVSGSLPAGISFTAANGTFHGIPTTLGIVSSVFHQLGPTNPGPDFTVTWNVLEGAPPIINSDTTLDVFLNEIASYRILTADADWNKPVPVGYRSFDLPNGLVLQDGVITGVPDVIPGLYPVFLQAKNKWGWGPLFNLIITVDVNLPEIFSPNSIDAIIHEPFFYQIVASNNPTLFGASGLPDGLEINIHTGIISGTPTGLSSAYQKDIPSTFTVDSTKTTQTFNLVHVVKISAVNRAGAAFSDLALNVKLPDVPVIDTTTLDGHAITAQIDEPFTFQFSASNNPTSWTAYPLPQGIMFDSATGRIFGQFQANGFYNITFVAFNAGGGSAPAVVHFAVGVTEGGIGPAPEVTVTLDLVNLWVDLNTAQVSLDGRSQSKAVATVKRGDSTTVNVVFHRDGIPAGVHHLSGLSFGAKVKFDDEDYVVYTNAFTIIAVGTYRVNPDFSDQNNELDSLLVTDKVDLIGEIQWDTDEGVRRSSQTFGVTVLRDLLHPDPVI